MWGVLAFGSCLFCRKFFHGPTNFIELVLEVRVEERTVVVAMIIIAVCVCMIC